MTSQRVSPPSTHIKACTVTPVFHMALIASAPATFQKTMDVILQGIPQVSCYIEDILVTGKDDALHLQNLQEVLTRLEKFGLNLNRSKCEFMMDSVEYQGYKIGAHGVHTVSSKVHGSHCECHYTRESPAVEVNRSPS